MNENEEQLIQTDEAQEALTVIQVPCNIDFLGREHPFLRERHDSGTGSVLGLINMVVRGHRRHPETIARRLLKRQGWPKLKNRVERFNRKLTDYLAISNEIDGDPDVRGGIEAGLGRERRELIDEMEGFRARWEDEVLPELRAKRLEIEAREATAEAAEQEAARHKRLNKGIAALELDAHQTSPRLTQDLAPLVGAVQLKRKLDKNE
jgi:hypothetical protein